MATVIFCRICFRNNNILRKLHELDIDGIRLSDKLRSCVPEILYTSELDKYESICIECCQFLKTAYMFKELCIRSNILLQGSLSSGNHPLENLENLSSHYLSDEPEEQLVRNTLPEHLQKSKEVTIMKKENMHNLEETIIKEEYTTLPEQFVSTHLSDSDNSLDDYSKRSSINDSNDSADSIYSSHLRSMLEAAKNVHNPHVKKGKGSFICEFCNNRFSKKSYLKKHMFIHSGERPFICFLCNTTFNRKKTLQTHMLIHTGIKNFKCHICEKSFRIKCSLDRHMVTHSSYKAFKCNTCGKSFRRKDHLEKHYKVHKNLLNTNEQQTKLLEKI